MQPKHIWLGLLNLITLGCMTVAGVPVLFPRPVAISANPGKSVPVKATRTPFQPVTNTPSSSSTISPESTKKPVVTRTPPTRRPTRKPKPTISPTVEWSFHGPGAVTAPIIFYHHVTPGDPPNIYCVSADAFGQQMDYLQTQGYMPIPISLLVKAIREGANLPDRPVVITFDDGNRDIYENAFPIMQKLGFSGTIYLVVNYLNQDPFLSTDQVIEMAQAGWEIGSHSMSHPDLAGMQVATYYEVATSKKILMADFNAPINTFAYPFAETDADITNQVINEYTAAVGVGDSSTHSMADIYYLDRIEIGSEMDLTAFANALPW